MIQVKVKDTLKARFRSNRRVLFFFLAIVLGGFFAILTTPTIQGTLKYKKDTGKKCTYCHTGIPEPGDEDAQLNDRGEKFREDGYKLPPS